MATHLEALQGPSRPKTEVDTDQSFSAYGKTRSTIQGWPLSADELRKIDAYWRASLYLCMGMLYLAENPLLREPLLLEHTKKRLLGHWGIGSRSMLHVCPFQPADQQVRPRRDLRVGTGARRTVGALPGVSRGDLLGDLPRQERGRGRAAALLQAVLLSGRDRQPRNSRDARIHPRGRRAWLFAVACVRRGVRPSRPHHPLRRWRWRVRDGAARYLLALEQVPQPDHRRRRTAGLAPERIQDQQPHTPRAHQSRRAAKAVRGLRLEPVFRRGMRAREHAPGDGRLPGALRPPDPGAPGTGSPLRSRQESSLAHGHLAEPEGVDGAAQGGRTLPGGVLAIPPDPDPGHRAPPRPRRAARGMDA